MMLSYVYSIMAPNGERLYFLNDTEARAYAQANPMPIKSFKNEDSDDENATVSYQEKSYWRKQPYVKVNGDHYINEDGVSINVPIQSFSEVKQSEEPSYMYQIVARKTNEPLGIFSTLKKEKDTVNDLLDGIRGGLEINRLPIDTVSYFDPDLVWETLRVN